MFIYLAKTRQSACLISGNSGRNVKLQLEPFHCKLFELRGWLYQPAEASALPLGRLRAGLQNLKGHTELLLKYKTG